MQARVKIQNEICVVSLAGRVDVETAEPFRAACARELKGKRVVFDFSGLMFVGSQGLLPFLETLQAFHDQSPGAFKFSGVGVEFAKLFAATPLNVVEIHPTIDQAVLAFYIPKTSVASPAIQAAPLTAGDFVSYRQEPTPSEAKAAAIDDDLDA